MWKCRYIVLVLEVLYVIGNVRASAVFSEFDDEGKWKETYALVILHVFLYYSW